MNRRPSWEEVRDTTIDTLANLALAIEHRSERGDLLDASERSKVLLYVENLRHFIAKAPKKHSEDMMYAVEMVMEIVNQNSPPGELMN